MVWLTPKQSPNSSLWRLATLSYTWDVAWVRRRKKLWAWHRLIPPSRGNPSREFIKNVITIFLFAKVSRIWFFIFWEYSQNSNINYCYNTRKIQADCDVIYLYSFKLRYPKWGFRIRLMKRAYKCDFHFIFSMYKYNMKTWFFINV